MHKPSNDEIHNALTIAICSCGCSEDEYALQYLRANLDKLLAPSWQPIETAPVESKPTQRPKMLLVYHDGRFTEGVRIVFGWKCPRTGVWQTDKHDPLGYFIEIHPTHWQLLPQPPTEDHAETS